MWSPTFLFSEASNVRIGLAEFENLEHDESSIPQLSESGRHESGDGLDYPSLHSDRVHGKQP